MRHSLHTGDHLYRDRTSFQRVTRSWQLDFDVKSSLRFYVTSVKKYVPPGILDRRYSGMGVFNTGWVDVVQNAEYVFRFCNSDSARLRHGGIKSDPTLLDWPRHFDRIYQ